MLLIMKKSSLPNPKLINKATQPPPSKQDNLPLVFGVVVEMINAAPLARAFEPLLPSWWHCW